MISKLLWIVYKKKRPAEKYKEATLVYDPRIGGIKYPWSWWYDDTTQVSSAKTKETVCELVDVEENVRMQQVINKLKE